MAEVTNVCYTCQYIYIMDTQILVTEWLQSLTDNLTLPTEGEVEESRISCVTVIDLVPIKRHCTSHQKGFVFLPPLYLYSPLFVKCEFLVLLFKILHHATFSHLCVFVWWHRLHLLCFACVAGLWAVSRQSLGGFLHEIGCWQGLICGSSPQLLPNVVHRMVCV